ncbi:beta-1,3-galactosyltransferase 5-like [Convolutriloba macropyga]|uniref:beta-1,3-galactosyltransferase 5-like n=1 Tax=Convolutriloba macropyga TaxID=536237 RepID=UPI003F524999
MHIMAVKLLKWSTFFLFSFCVLYVVPKLPTYRQLAKRNFNKTLLHPEALYHKLPSENDLYVSNLSSNLTSCGDYLTRDNLRVLVILSRVTSRSLRDDVRSTYLSILNNINSNEILVGKWKVFFLLGKPKTSTQTSQIEKENKQNQDLIVANVEDDYFGLPLKMLVGLKIIARFCSNAKYFIKSDDDVYLRLLKVDRIIDAMQLRVNFKQLNGHSRRHNFSSLGETDVPLYTGAPCEEYPVLRSGKFKVSRREFPYRKFPFYCAGSLYIISMSAVHNMVNDCPYHCVGHGTLFYQNNLHSNCFHKFEDGYLGSCVHLQESVVMTSIDSDLGYFVTVPSKKYPQLEDLKDWDNYIGLHTAENLKLQEGFGAIRKLQQIWRKNVTQMKHIHRTYQLISANYQTN